MELETKGLVLLSERLILPSEEELDHYIYYYNREENRNLNLKVEDSVEWSQKI